MDSWSEIMSAAYECKSYWRRGKIWMTGTPVNATTTIERCLIRCDQCVTSSRFLLQWLAAPPAPSTATTAPRWLRKQQQEEQWQRPALTVRKKGTNSLIYRLTVQIDTLALV